MAHKIRLSLSLCLVMIFLISCPNLCLAEEAGNISDNPYVLFLSSYSYEWESIPEQLRGVEKILNGYATVDYVFMDTKRLNYEDVKADVYADIKEREERERYDYVIAGDDAALTFVMEYQKELFGQTPIIFEGINNENFAQKAAEDPLVTGIVETFPLEDTIELALKLQPEATRIVGISDDTQSGLGSTEQLMDLQEDFPDILFETLDCGALTCQELGQTVASYDETVILIFLMMSHDLEGNTYSNTEAVEYISECAGIPIYKADELGMGQGIFGGVVLSY